MKDIYYIVKGICSKANTDYDLVNEQIKNYGHIILDDKIISDLLLYIEQNKKKERNICFGLSLIIIYNSTFNQETYLLCAQLAINISYFSFAIQLLKELEKHVSENTKKYGILCSLLGRSYRNSFEFPKSLKYYKTAKRTFNKLDDSLNEGWMLYSIGKLYLNYLQQPSRSIDFFRQAQKIFEKNDDAKSNRGISACLDELGDVYRQAFKDYKKALEFYNDAKKFNSQKTYYYKLGLSRNYAHIGQCYEYMGKLNKAEGFLNQSINILHQFDGQDKGLGIRLTQLGNIYLKNNKHEKAIEVLKKGQKYNLKISNFIKYIILNNIYQGDYYSSFDQSNTISKYNEAIEQARKSFHFDLAATAFKKLSDIYFKMQLYKESKQAITESLLSNIYHWEKIASGSPKLHEVTEQIELGEMYQSLFNRLIFEYKTSYSTSIKALTNVYEKLYFEQLSNINKLIKYGNLMSGIKHEIQNLHNNIVSVLDDVLIEKEISEENFILIKKLKNDIYSKSQILSNTNLKEIISSLDRKGANFENILNNQINILKNDFRFQNIIFKIRAKSIIGRVILDENSLKYILFNLFLNSVEAYGFSESNTEKIISIETERIKNIASINIKDNAGGINEKALNRIFEFGYSTKGGTGYGLPSIKSLLMQFEGTIDITSELNQTSINIKIPCYE